MKKFKLGICMWGFPMQGPVGLKIAAEMGFQGAAISFGKYENNFPLMNPRIRDEYLKASREAEIELITLSVEHLNNYGLSNPMDSQKGMIALEGCKKAIFAAAKMGIEVIQLPCFNDGAICSAEDFKNTCEKLKLLCDIAAREGIIIGVEHVLLPEEYMQMVQEVHADNLKVIFDSQNYHLHQKGNTAEILRQIHSHVIQMHVKDGYNGKISASLLGKGDSGFQDTAKVIKETQCTSWILLENYYNARPLNLLYDDQFEIVRRDMRIAQDVFNINDNEL